METERDYSDLTNSTMHQDGFIPNIKTIVNHSELTEVASFAYSLFSSARALLWKLHVDIEQMSNFSLERVVRIIWSKPIGSTVMTGDIDCATVERYTIRLRGNRV